MSEFRRRLAALDEGSEDRRWLYVPYDQLSDGIGPLASEPPETLGIVLVESAAKAARRPYHRQKLALVLVNQRHFALEQAARGVAVDYVMTELGYSAALARVIARRGQLRMMEAAEWELRRELKALVEDGRLEVVPHEGWLTTAEQFSRTPGPPWKMDSFYRLVRRESGLLMEGGKPLGGKFSFDAENRRAWPGEPAAPTPPVFDPDEVTLEVAELIETRFRRHPGELRPSALPATRTDAVALWRWGRESCLPHFGPYEDAMSATSRSLFHTRVSSLLNLHRLLPADLVSEVVEMEAPLASREGFVRQILGWREFVRHVHRETEGFRRPPDVTAGGAEGSPSSRSSEARAVEAEGAQPRSDGGWERWSGEPWADRGPAGSSGTRRAEAELRGARPSTLAADWPLPPVFWGARSGLRCLDRIVEQVWEEGYTHHIPRLMVLANLATLLGVEPRDLTDWFWAAFTDAFDWVVEPNVLGMGTFAVGELFTTKPYVSGANYIHRMSDYCEGCRFDPKKTCPITRLYWAFLDRNRIRLEANQRLRLVFGSLRRRSEDERREDRRVFERVRERLREGVELDLPEA